MGVEKTKLYQIGSIISETIYDNYEKRNQQGIRWVNSADRELACSAQRSPMICEYAFLCRKITPSILYKEEPHGTLAPLTHILRRHLCRFKRPESPSLSPSPVQTNLCSNKPHNLWLECSLRYKSPQTRQRYGYVPSPSPHEYWMALLHSIHRVLRVAPCLEHGDYFEGEIEKRMSTLMCVSQNFFGTLSSQACYFFQKRSRKAQVVELALQLSAFKPVCHSRHRVVGGTPLSTLDESSVTGRRSCPDEISKDDFSVTNSTC
ncbi:hypothetical protein J6590_011262 [Homalodisca vitripennis]|nr:hypothetical protein J6590_011262 [Homalodisca vitripennis]